MKPFGPGRPGSPGFPSSPGIPGGPGGPMSPLIPKKQTYVDIAIQYCSICPYIYLYTIVSFILTIKNFTTSLKHAQGSWIRVRFISNILYGIFYLWHILK